MIDVAGGDKIPRKGGPGITRSGLLVINKIDLAPHVGASLEVMDRDSRRKRGDRPFVFTNLKTEEGLDKVIAWLEEQRAHGLTASGRPAIIPHSHSHDEDDQRIGTTSARQARIRTEQRAVRSLDAEVRLHHFVRQLPDGPGGDAAAFVENAELARHAPRERQFLLDQKHRQPFLFIQPQNDVADFVHDIGLNPFGRLIQNQQLRLQHQRAADRQLLLLAARKIAAAPVQHLLQHRETYR